MAVGLLFKSGCKLILNQFNTFLRESLVSIIFHSYLIRFLSYFKFWEVSCLHSLTCYFCDLFNLQFWTFYFRSYNPTNPWDSQLFNQLESVRPLTLNIIIKSLILDPAKLNFIHCAFALLDDIYFVYKSFPVFG